ncbi:MAG: hypothetical protein VB035_10110 [Candidatus Fimivivens sp.]|nr:hypothetical protein [Candidatus Fimivivens sp.]
MDKEQNVIDLLLNLDPPSLPEKDIKIKRLTKLCGADVVFKIRALPYSKVADVRKLAGDDMGVDIVLAGVVSPDLKDGRLLQKYKAITPAELVKTMLLPGEIEDVSREIEKLSGFRAVTIEDIKKK